MKNISITFLQTTFFKYVFSSYVLALTGLISGFFTYRFIEPKQMGIFLIFSTYETYVTFIRLGIINGLGRELPYLFGAKQNKKAKELASTGLVYTIVTNILLLLVFLPYVFIFFKKELQDSYFLYSCLVFICRILFTSYSNFLSVTYRTNNDFRSLSLVNNYMSIFRLLSVFLILNFGFWGFLVREILISFSEMIFLHRMRPLSLSFGFKWNAFIRLFKVGFPLFIASYLYMFSENIPRLFLIQFGSVEQLGLFSPIIVIMNIASLFGNSVNSYLYPKIAFDFGKNGDPKSIWKQCLIGYKASIFGSIIIFPILCIGIYFFPIVFPKYAQAQYYLIISIFSIFFLGYRTGNHVFSNMSRGLLSIINSFFCLLFSIISLYILTLFLKDQLLIATLSLVINFFLMYLLTLGLSWYTISKDFTNSVILK
jgi:O-antigen/teichoic acid export membrane protein